MNQQTLILEAIKKTMKLKGLRYQDLAAELGLSLPTVKRLFTAGELTISRLDQICKFLDIRMNDLFKMIEDESSELPEILTLEQENFLAKKPERLSYLELLLHGMKPKQIEKEFGLDPESTIKILSELDKWKLIDWLPGNRIRFKTARDIQLRADGPLRKLISEKGLRSFLEHNFSDELELHDFATFKVSEDTLRKFNSRLKKLVRETMKEGHLEESSDISTVNIGTFLAVRKWRIVDLFPL